MRQQLHRNDHVRIIHNRHLHDVPHYIHALQLHTTNIGLNSTPHFWILLDKHARVYAKISLSHSCIERFECRTLHVHQIKYENSEQEIVTPK